MWRHKQDAKVLKRVLASSFPLILQGVHGGYPKGVPLPYSRCISSAGDPPSKTGVKHAKNAGGSPPDNIVKTGWVGVLYSELDAFLYRAQFFLL